MTKSFALDGCGVPPVDEGACGAGPTEVFLDLPSALIFSDMLIAIMSDEGVPSLELIGNSLGAGACEFLDLEPDPRAGIPSASFSLFSFIMTSARARVSPLARYFLELLASLPCLLYIRESAAVYNLFHPTSSTPGGVGAASGYLYLNPGTLLMISCGSNGLDGGNTVCVGVAADWESFGRLLGGSEFLVCSHIG